MRRAAHAVHRVDDVPWVPGRPTGLWGRLCAAIAGREPTGEDETGDIWEIES